MRITKVHIENYRAIRNITVEFNEGVNLIVGDNEAGKSTLLEAIHAAVTGQIGGRSLRYQLHPHLFNQETVKAFAADVAAKKNPPPPTIVIEVYFDDDDQLARLRGSINSRKEEANGVWIKIRVREECVDDFVAYVNGTADIDLVPVEFFGVEWMSFAYAPVTSRQMPFKSRLIDTTGTNAGYGTSRYLAQIVEDHLTPKERTGLSLAYRAMKRTFEQAPEIQKINGVLATRKGQVSEKNLTVAMDVSTSSEWGEGVVPQLDGIPFDLVGRGEQSAASIWLAVDGASQAHLVMIEEPENHLAYTRLNALLARAAEQTESRQLIVVTHSSFVVNKLGLSDVLLFNSATGAVRLTDLDASTTDFFRRLPGHDTLRMVLAKRVILVEGPSDELIVQRAFRDLHGKRPIEAGVDVLAVRGLSFKRFLNIARKLGKPVAVVTDNDGNTVKKMDSYKAYAGMGNIRVCVSEEAHGRTLEPQLVHHNTIEKLRTVLGQAFADKPAAAEWMLDNKTEAAILVHDAKDRLDYPKYLLDAIA